MDNFTLKYLVKREKNTVRNFRAFIIAFPPTIGCIPPVLTSLKPQKTARGG